MSVSLQAEAWQVLKGQSRMFGEGRAISLVLICACGARTG